MNILTENVRVKLKKFIPYFIKRATKLESTSTPFSMKYGNYKCGTPQCVMGYLIAYDSDLVDELKAVTDNSIEDWYFLFAGKWAKYPSCNTIEQAVKRFKYYLKHGATPKGWKYGDVF